MDRKILLAKLEGLYNKKEVKEGFPSLEALLDWSNTVAPLLSFNKDYHTNFVVNAHKFNLPISSYPLEPALKIMTSQLKMAIEELKNEEDNAPEKTDTKVSVESYVDAERLEELKNIPTINYDLTRLIRMLEELNVCSQADCHMATIMLVRAVLDHVPPIFGCSKFSEVANNFKAQQKSFKESMEHLDNSSRKIADQHLHCHIRKKEVLPNKTQVNFRNDLDVLLAEIVRILK